MATEAHIMPGQDIVCPYCEEPVASDDPTFPIRTAKGPELIHEECLIRLTFGSAAHQLGDCSCCGGTRSDPPGKSMRDSARLARDAFEVMRDRTTKEVIGENR
jgi:hypothetical protein